MRLGGEGRRRGWEWERLKKLERRKGWKRKGNGEGKRRGDIDGKKYEEVIVSVVIDKNRG